MQSGEGFCHLNTWTCWGQCTGLKALELTVNERIANATPGSYTRRLIDDPTLLMHKVFIYNCLLITRTFFLYKTNGCAGGYVCFSCFSFFFFMSKPQLLEESQELCEATEKDHVAAEMADLLYFATVACMSKGTTIADAEYHLELRKHRVFIYFLLLLFSCLSCLFLFFTRSPFYSHHD